MTTKNIIQNKKISYIFILLLIFSSLLSLLLFNFRGYHISNSENENKIISSAVIGEITLTNTKINNTDFIIFLLII